MSGGTGVMICGHGSRDAFDYAYGVLHAPDFRAFADAGRALAALHLGYETGPEYPLETVCAELGEPHPEDFRIGDRPMRFLDAERTALRVNDRIGVRGVPAAAHRYVVDGRTPLEWFIDRYRIVRDKRSGILNDPNAWFADPRALIPAIRRVVHVSVETARIIENLPPTEPAG